MPSRKFLLVVGVPGHPVSDPWNPGANPARYIGFKLKDKPAEDPDHVLEHYEPEPQVVADHPDLQAAIKRGAPKKLGECIAKNHDEAGTKLSAFMKTPAAAVLEPTATKEP